MTTDLELAQGFHEIYERLAPAFGYQTRETTREFNATSPNGQLMIAVCNEILERFAVGIYNFELPPIEPAADMFQTIINQMSPYLKTLEENSKIAVIAKMAAIMQPDHLYLVDEDLAQQVLSLYNACAAVVKRENE